MKTILAPTMDANAVDDPRKINPDIWTRWSLSAMEHGNNVRRLRGTYHRHETRKRSRVQRHLEAGRHLRPPARARKCVVPRGRPDLTARPGNIGNSTPKHAECKGCKKDNRRCFTTRRLIINFYQGESTGRSDDSLDISNDEQTSRGKWPCYT